MQDFKKYELVAIVVDSQEENLALTKKLKVTFPILSDAKRATIKAYGLHDVGNDISWPAIYVVDADGKVKWRSLLERYDVRPAVAEVIKQL